MKGLPTTRRDTELSTPENDGSSVTQSVEKKGIALPQPKYIVHRNTRKLHTINGCGYSKTYNARNYCEYYTLSEAYAEHGDEIRPCKICSQSYDLKNPPETT